jgi:hypothetical protein
MSIAPTQQPTDLVEINGGELVDLRDQPTALEAITRAEVDVQIQTAKRFPRSLARFMTEAKGMVALDPDLAAQCTYCLPARKGGRDNQPITGPSVRLAEIVAVCWGNLRVVGRITDDDGKMVTAQAVAMDLERNVGYSVEVKRGITTREGRRFGDDMVKVTCQAAISIATRNATFKVIPRAFVNLIEDEAARVAKGDVRTLPERTARAVGYFVGRGVSEERIFTGLGITGPADMTLDLLAKLNGFKVAINEGHATLDEVFPLTQAEPAPTTPPKSLADKVKSQAAPREPGSDG